MLQYKKLFYFFLKLNSIHSKKLSIFSVLKVYNPLKADLILVYLHFTINLNKSTYSMQLEKFLQTR